jgi:hypothetical protein
VNTSVVARPSAFALQRTFRLRPVAEIEVSEAMSGSVDVAARIAAVCYTLVVGAGIWFTLAWAGEDAHWDLGEVLVFSTLSLSPIPVCIHCFNRRP